MIEIRTLPLRLELRDDGDGRTLTGLAVPYGVQARIGSYVESFTLGVFANTNPERVPLLGLHDHESYPLGRAVELVEQADGLHGSFRVSATVAGSEALTLVRDGALTGLSVGFIPIDNDWNADRTRVVRRRAELVEISLTPFPSYPDARIAAIRAARRDGVPLRTLLALRRRAA